MTANDRLAEIQARADKATDGPWEKRLVDGWEAEDGSTSYRGGVYRTGGGPRFVTNHIDAADAEFIAHARTDVPALVAALRAVDEVTRLHRSRLPKASRCNCLACQSWRAIEAALGEVAS